MMETIGMMAVTALWCAAAVLCYRQGLADGGSLSRQGRLDQPERRQQGQQGEQAEQGRLRRLMDRIDRYDGRSGQQGGN